MTLSFKNRPWVLPHPDAHAAEALSQAGALRPLAARVLAGRGHTPTHLAAFLDPQIKAELPDPAVFLDMQPAVERLARAILGNERITIWSDYDVDGACAGAIMARFLRAHGAEQVTVRIPDRITEGYGPNTAGLQALHAEGTTLVCVLDSGTTAFEPLEAAAAMGLDVVVIDHHMATDTLPPALALINPNRKDQPAGYGHLCAASMAFIVAVATNTYLRTLGQPGVPLMPLVGLAALATVCDVVSLTGLNRAIVAQGLPLLSKRTYPGIAALADAAAIEGPIDVAACGFALGPRINAGGRIGDSSLGVRLLTTDDPDEARALAGELDTLNHQRRALERACTAQAMKDLSPHFIPGTTRALALAIVEAHEGVVGISAARVREAFDAPAFVLAPAEHGLLKGSGRSVPGFDLGAAVVRAHAAGLLVKGGGHPMAAGITIAPDKVGAFIAFINQAIATSAYGQEGVPLHADAAVRVGDLTEDWVRELDILGPFGMGNPTPRLLLTQVRVVNTYVLKDKATQADKHVKLIVQDASGRGPRLQAPLWGACGTPLEAAFTNAGSAPLDLICAAEINTWDGRTSIQLRVEDARLSAPVVAVDAPEDALIPF